MVDFSMIVIYQITEDSIRSEVCCWVWEIITHTEGEIIGKIDFEFDNCVINTLQLLYLSFQGRVLRLKRANPSLP